MYGNVYMVRLVSKWLKNPCRTNYCTARYEERTRSLELAWFFFLFLFCPLTSVSSYANITWSICTLMTHTHTHSSSHISASSVRFGMQTFTTTNFGHDAGCQAHEHVHLNTSMLKGRWLAAAGHAQAGGALGHLFASRGHGRKFCNHYRSFVSCLIWKIHEYTLYINLKKKNATYTSNRRIFCRLSQLIINSANLIQTIVKSPPQAQRDFIRCYDKDY